MTILLDLLCAKFRAKLFAVDNFLSEIRARVSFAKHSAIPISQIIWGEEFPEVKARLVTQLRMAWMSLTNTLEHLSFVVKFAAFVLATMLTLVNRNIIVALATCMSTAEFAQCEAIASKAFISVLTDMTTFRPRSFTKIAFARVICAQHMSWCTQGVLTVLKRTDVTTKLSGLKIKGTLVIVTINGTCGDEFRTKAIGTKTLAEFQIVI
jgi:hypothetical protein